MADYDVTEIANEDVEDTQVPIASTTNAGVAQFDPEDFTVDQNGLVKSIQKTGAVQYIGKVISENMSSGSDLLQWELLDISAADITKPKAGQLIMASETWSNSRLGVSRGSVYKIVSTVAGIFTTTTEEFSLSGAEGAPGAFIYFVNEDDATTYFGKAYTGLDNDVPLGSFEDIPLSIFYPNDPIVTPLSRFVLYDGRVGTVTVINEDNTCDVNLQFNIHGLEGRPMITRGMYSSATTPTLNATNVFVGYNNLSTSTDQLTDNAEVGDRVTYYWHCTADDYVYLVTVRVTDVNSDSYKSVYGTIESRAIISEPGVQTEDIEDGAITANKIAINHALKPFNLGETLGNLNGVLTDFNELLNTGVGVYSFSDTPANAPTTRKLNDYWIVLVIRPEPTNSAVTVQIVFENSFNGSNSHNVWVRSNRAGWTNWVNLYIDRNNILKLVSDSPTFTNFDDAVEAGYYIIRNVSNIENRPSDINTGEYTNLLVFGLNVNIVQVLFQGEYAPSTNTADMWFRVRMNTWTSWYNVKLADGTVTTEKLADGAVTTEKAASMILSSANSLVQALLSTNSGLFNSVSVINGYYFSLNNYLQSADLISKYCAFKCEPGDVFLYKGNANANVAAAQFYDENLNFISSLTNYTKDNYSEITIPENCKYVRFTSFEYSNNKDNVILSVYKKNSQINSDAIPDNSIPFTKLSGVPSSAKSVLYGKKYVACGDSFTAAAGLSANASYASLIAERNAMTLVNMSEGGACAHYATDRGSFVRSDWSGYYKNIPSDADYITIAFGLNEFNNELGTSASSDNTTIWGAYNEALAWLIENRSSAKILIIASDAWFTYDLRNTLKDIAAYWGVGFLDLKAYGAPLLIGGKYSQDGSVSSTAVSLRNTQYQISAEDSHPNAEGYKARSTIIEQAMKNL